MRALMVLVVVLSMTTAAKADWWSNRWHDLNYGPGPGNWLLSGPLPKAADSLQRGSDDLLHGKAPGPAILGTVGHTRVCLPWC
jgi:hypothetical protein